MSRARVRYATIFIFPGGARGKSVTVNAAPERLTVRPGDVIDWTVVNIANVPGRVSIAWKDGSPMRTDPDPFPRAGRGTVRTKVKAGVYRYSILLDGKEVFDPEVEIMQ